MREPIVDVSQILRQLESLLELLSEIRAEEWREWLADTYERAAGKRGPAVQWVDLLWFFRLNFVPLLRFIQTRSPIPIQDAQSASLQLSHHFEKLLKALDPDQPVEVCGFLNEGSRNDCTQVLGPLMPADTLASKVAAFMREYGEAIASENFEAAYQLTSTRYQSLRGLRAYRGAYSRAAHTYGGEKIVGYSLHSIQQLYTSDDAISLRRLDKQWPAGVHFEDRRANAIIYLCMNNETEYGFWQTLRIMEDKTGLRVAKFGFFTQ